MSIKIGQQSTDRRQKQKETRTIRRLRQRRQSRQARQAQKANKEEKEDPDKDIYLRHNELLSHDWGVLQELVKILRPFKTVTKRMKGRGENKSFDYLPVFIVWRTGPPDARFFTPKLALFHLL